MPHTRTIVFVDPCEPHPGQYWGADKKPVEQVSAACCVHSIDETMGRRHLIEFCMTQGIQWVGVRTHEQADDLDDRVGYPRYVRLSGTDDPLYNPTKEILARRDRAMVVVLSPVLGNPDFRAGLPRVAQFFHGFSDLYRTARAFGGIALLHQHMAHTDRELEKALSSPEGQIVARVMRGQGAGVPFLV